jgi:hypothetical protein
MFFFNRNRVGRSEGAQIRGNGEGEDWSERCRQVRKRKAVSERQLKESDSRDKHVSSNAKKYVRTGVLLSLFLCLVLEMGRKPCQAMIHQNSNRRLIFHVSGSS